ncbi:Coenzyme F420 hydrogenase/dehydrogenase, beta subunit C-terminal domain [bacterium]|nr:Coenzyme F420 hydrogenase/dehydrogenase, beta subunit C-terminal domain [bacterium]
MNHLCVGCGLCAMVCPKGRIQMVFSPKEGYYQPSFGFEQCNKACGMCEKVCPFVPDNPDTLNITNGLFSSVIDIKHDDVMGYYLDTFAGYSETHRLNSASGGLVTWLLEALLAKGEIDGAVCVGSDSKSPTLFDFKVCRTSDEIKACSGSCYQPVEISRALKKIMTLEGRYAVVALPCMARALRLAMHNIPGLKSRIRFVLGLVCGQMKSRHFINYLCLKYDKRTDLASIFFRCKRSEYPASDFAFRLIWDDGQKLEIGWSKGIARLWKERWFTLETCDYCDDVFSECADATFMDAWLPEYIQDSRGNSLLIIRENKLLDCLKEATNSTSLKLLHIEHIRVRESQIGLIHQKRVLAYIIASKRHVRYKRLPDLRLLEKKIRFDYKWEAAVKSKVRSFTQHNIQSDLKSFERHIAHIQMFWNLMERAKSRLWHLLNG